MADELRDHYAHRVSCLISWFCFTKMGYIYIQTTKMSNLHSVDDGMR